MEKWQPLGSKPVALIIGMESGYRGASLELELRERGFDIVRIQGVRVPVNAWDEMPTDLYDEAAAQIVMRRGLTRGEVGCALAHRNAAQHLLDSGLQSALVLEDDARFVGSWTAADAPWELLNSGPAIVNLFSHANSAVVASAPVARHPGVWRAVIAPIMATGYLINRQAAEIMASPTPIRHVADWPLDIASQARFYLTYPWKMVPDQSVPSTLESDRSQTVLLDKGDGVTKALRHFAAALHITYLRNQRAYGSWRSYYVHEIKRLILTNIAVLGRSRVAWEGPRTLPFRRRRRSSRCWRAER